MYCRENSYKSKVATFRTNDLQTLLQALNLNANGKRSELRDRLLNLFNQRPVGLNFNAFFSMIDQIYNSTHMNNLNTDQIYNNLPQLSMPMEYNISNPSSGSQGNVFFNSQQYYQRPPPPPYPKTVCTPQFMTIPTNNYQFTTTTNNNNISGYQQITPINTFSQMSTDQNYIKEMTHTQSAYVGSHQFAQPMENMLSQSLPYQNYLPLINNNITSETPQLITTPTNNYEINVIRNNNSIANHVPTNSTTINSQAITNQYHISGMSNPESTFTNSQQHPQPMENIFTHSQPYQQHNTLPSYFNVTPTNNYGMINTMNNNKEFNYQQVIPQKTVSQMSTTHYYNKGEILNPQSIFIEPQSSSQPIENMYSYSQPHYQCSPSSYYSVTPRSPLPTKSTKNESGIVITPNNNPKQIIPQNIFSQMSTNEYVMKEVFDSPSTSQELQASSRPQENYLHNSPKYYQRPPPPPYNITSGLTVTGNNMNETNYHQNIPSNVVSQIPTNKQHIETSQQQSISNTSQSFSETLKNIFRFTRNPRPPPPYRFNHLYQSPSSLHRRTQPADITKSTENYGTIFTKSSNMDNNVQLVASHKPNFLKATNQHFNKQISNSQSTSNESQQSFQPPEKFFPSSSQSSVNRKTSTASQIKSISIDKNEMNITANNCVEQRRQQGIHNAVTQMSTNQQDIIELSDSSSVFEDNLSPSRPQENVFNDSVQNYQLSPFDTSSPLSASEQSQKKDRLPSFQYFRPKPSYNCLPNSTQLNTASMGHNEINITANTKIDPNYQQINPHNTTSQMFY